MRARELLAVLQTVPCLPGGWQRRCPFALLSIALYRIALECFMLTLPSLCEDASLHRRAHPCTKLIAGMRPREATEVRSLAYPLTPFIQICASAPSLPWLPSLLLQILPGVFLGPYGAAKDRAE